MTLRTIWGSVVATRAGNWAAGSSGPRAPPAAVWAGASGTGAGEGRAAALRGQADWHAASWRKLSQTSSWLEKHWYFRRLCMGTAPAIRYGRTLPAQEP